MFLYFITAAMISFIGSLQPGPVNMAVIGASSNRRFRQAVMIAIGGSLPECIFALFAIFASASIASHKQLLSELSGLAALVLLSIGLWLLFSKTKVVNQQQYQSKNGLGLGLTLSFLNPQLMLFWVGIITWMELHQFPVSTVHPLIKFSFITGTFAGAFVLHLLLISLCIRYQQTNLIRVFAVYSNKILGAVLCAVACVEFISLY